MISQLFSDDLSEHASVDCWKKQSIASIVQCGQLMTYQYSRIVNRDLDIVMVCLDSNIFFIFLFLSIFLDLIFLFLFLLNNKEVHNHSHITCHITLCYKPRIWEKELEG